MEKLSFFVQLNQSLLQDFVDAQVLRPVCLAKTYQIHQHLLPFLGDVIMMSQIFQPLPQTFQLPMFIFQMFPCNLLMHLDDTLSKFLVFMHFLH